MDIAIDDHQIADSDYETESNMKENEEILQDCAFLNIPVEIFLHICSFLDARFISNSLSLVCKYFNEILSDESVWKSRIAKHYSSIYPALLIDDPENFDWREACAKIEEEYNLWHNKENDMKRILLKDIHYASVDAVLLMKSGSLCFSGSRDYNLVAWDINKGETCDPLPKKCIQNAHKGWIWNLESYEQNLYSCSWDGTVKVWDVHEDLKETLVFNCDHPALTMVCSPSVMAVGLFDKRVLLFDPRIGNKKIGQYKAHKGAVLAVTMVNGYIVSVSEDKSIVIWDHRSRQMLKRVLLTSEIPPSGAFPMCLSYNDNTIYIGDTRGLVHLMDPKNGAFAVVESYDVGHRGKMTCIYHSAGSVMTSSIDGTMRILAPTRKLETIAVLKSHSGEITNFDYKNNVLAVGSTDNFVEVWMPKSE